MVAGMIKGRARLQRLLWSPALAVPTMLVAGIATSVLEPALHGLGIARGSLTELVAAMGVSSAVGYISGRVLAKSASSNVSYGRGASIVDAEADGSRQQDTSIGRERSYVRDRGHSWRKRDAQQSLTLAGISIPKADETKHFKIIGATGTGKSTAIRELLAGALARGDRAIIADPDGGYLDRFYDERRGDTILNPFDRRAAKWDLYGEITNDYDIDQLARSLIPHEEGAEASWRAYARTFFRAVVAQTRDAGVRDVSELYHLLVVAQSDELKTLLAGTPAQPFLNEHNGRMFDSLRSVASSAVEALEFIGRQGGTELSVRDWVNNGQGVLFIPYQAGQIAALRSTISAWMRLAIFETMNRPERERPLWFVVDELDALGKIDGLKDALARLRKFDGRCLLGFQSIAQVSGTYGRAEAQTIVENCGNTLILRCSASERGGTSSFASQLIGQREVIRITQSRSKQPLRLLSSVTHTEHFNIEPAVLDSEIEQLPDLRGFLKLASAPHWRRIALSPLHLKSGAENVSSIRDVARRAWDSFRKRSGAAQESGRAADTADRDTHTGCGEGRTPDNFDR
jgi:type IV secretory pathway TraG/TraD family ATPase VirD4